MAGPRGPSCGFTAAEPTRDVRSARRLCRVGEAGVDKPRARPPVLPHWLDCHGCASKTYWGRWAVRVDRCDLPCAVRPPVRPAAPPLYRQPARYVLAGLPAGLPSGSAAQQGVSWACLAGIGWSCGLSGPACLPVQPPACPHRLSCGSQAGTGGSQALLEWLCWCGLSSGMSLAVCSWSRRTGLLDGPLRSCRQTVFWSTRRLSRCFLFCVLCSILEPG